MEKTIVIFGISTLRFAEMKKYCVKQTTDKKNGPKMPYLGIL